MSTIATDEVDAVMDQIRRWPAPTRIALARRILESLESLEAPATTDPVPEPPPIRPLRGVSADRAAGLLRTDRSPPTDEECRQIIEEESGKKYGS